MIATCGGFDYFQVLHDGGTPKSRTKHVSTSIQFVAADWSENTGVFAAHPLPREIQHKLVGNHEVGAVDGLGALGQRVRDPFEHRLRLVLLCGVIRVQNTDRIDRLEVWHVWVRRARKQRVPRLRVGGVKVV